MDIRKVFDGYKENIAYTRQYENELFVSREKEEWSLYYLSMIENKIANYKNNNELIQQLDQFLSKDLSMEEITLLYDLTIEMYREGYDDYLWLLKCLKKLIVYYEQDIYANKNKLIWLYVVYSFEDNVIKNRLFDSTKCDYTYLEKAIGLKEYYYEFSYEERFRIWAAFHNWIISSIEDEQCPVEECFDLLKCMIAFWESDLVQDLDGADEKIKDLILNTRIKLIRIITRIKSNENELLNRFMVAVSTLYEEEIGKVKSEYELEPILYAGKLYVLFLQKKRNINEIFDSYMDYFRYRSLKFKNEECPSMESLSLYDDSIQILSSWAALGVSKEKISKLVASCIVLTERRWRNVTDECITYLNSLMKMICQVITRYGSVYVNEEECVKQMILNRNLYLYFHCRKVEELATLIAERLYELRPDLLGSFGNMKKTELLDFVSGCALFHDIGKLVMNELLYDNPRDFTAEEVAFIMTHPKKSIEYSKEFDALKKYRDIMLFHHVSYDGKSGYPFGEVYEQEENKIIVDIIHIADEVEGELAAFFRSGEEIEDSIIFDRLRKGRGTEFHPEIIDLILNDEDLYHKFRLNIAGDNLQHIYEIVMGVNKVSIKQSFDEYFNEVNHKFKECEQSGNIESLKPLLNRLLELASEDNSNRNLGITYYVMMKYHFIKKEYMECTNYALEAVRYLENTEEYSYLSNLYSTLGYIMQYLGNSENGLGYYLRCAEYSKRYEGGELTRGIALNNIGTLIKEAYNYEKAFYYFESSLEYLKTNDVYSLRTLCSMIYCCYKLKKKDLIETYLTKVFALREKTGFEGFDTHVVLATVFHYLGREEEMEAEIKKIKNDTDVISDPLGYLHDIYAYLDLLEQLERYRESRELLDWILQFFEKNQIFNNIVASLIQRRMKVDIMLNDMEMIDNYGKYLYSAHYGNKEGRAKVILQMEKSHKENIAIQRKQREIMRQKKKLEQEMIVAQNANEEKTNFLTSMSHEIRTPIHAILGLDEMILRECHEESILQYAYDIQNAGKTLMGIINDVLDFSKMEEGQMELTPGHYHLSEVIQDLKNMMEPRAKEKQLGFFIHCNKDVPKELYGDSLRIKQIILNILTNAVKYTKEGQIDFFIEYEKVDLEHINLLISVKDTGIGMKKEHLEKLSNPFVRFEEGKNRDIEGTGLGMNIVTRLIKQMDGNLQVDSEYGKGSDFKISIPQTVIDWNGVGGFLEPKKPVGREKRQALFVAEEVNVLLVDDNAVNLKVVSSLLKRTKVNVTTATGGRECLDLCEKNHYHLIFLDHRMPDLDGVETLHILKEMKGININTPVVALTANAVVGGEEFYKSKGFDELITKPVNHEELERKMMNLLPSNLVQKL